MEQKEPSMEEILSSIRRILSNEEIDGNVLNKTQQDVSDGDFSAHPPQVVELTEDMMIQNQNTDMPQPTEQTNDALISEPTVQATVDSLSELTKVIEQEKEQSKEQPETSLESVVRSVLKPYLKEWLDVHLPEIVEKVVQKEVRRVIDRSDLS